MKKRRVGRRPIHASVAFGAVVAGVGVLTLFANFLHINGASQIQSAAVIQSELFALTNSERVQNNLAVLKENPVLDLAAAQKAEDMAAKGYFAHVAPNGAEPWVWI